MGRNPGPAREALRPRFLVNAEQMAAEAAARGDKAGEAYWLHVQEVVEQAPPLSPEQIARLRVLVWSDPEPHIEAA